MSHHVIKGSFLIIPLNRDINEIHIKQLDNVPSCFLEPIALLLCLIYIHLLTEQSTCSVDFPTVWICLIAFS